MGYTPLCRVYTKGPAVRGRAQTVLAGPVTRTWHGRWSRRPRPHMHGVLVGAGDATPLLMV